MHVLAIPSWYPSALRPTTGRYLREQFVALRERGANVGVIYPENYSMRRLSLSALRKVHLQYRHSHEENVPTIRWHGWNIWLRTPLRFFWLMRKTRQLAQLYEKHYGRPDLVHAHSAQWAAAAARKISEAWEIPYIVTEHFSGFDRGNLTRDEDILARWGLAGAEYILAVSSFLKKTLVANHYAPNNAVQVIPNPVDTRYFYPPNKNVDDGTTFRWVTVANPNPRRGIDVLLRAFRLVAERTHAELHIAGVDSQQNALARLARTLQIDNQVRFLGRLSQRDVRAELWKADAYVCASRIETFGIPIIEAMATGLPVVATDCGGPRDIIRASNGLIAPSEDASALAKAMLTLQHHIADYEEVAIRRYIVDHYSNDVICGQLLRLYQSLISA